MKTSFRFTDLLTSYCTCISWYRQFFVCYFHERLLLESMKWFLHHFFEFFPTDFIEDCMSCTVLTVTSG